MTRKYGESIPESWDEMTVIERRGLLLYIGREPAFANAKWSQLPTPIRQQLARVGGSL